jgi:hypothetical protein
VAQGGSAVTGIKATRSPGFGGAITYAVSGTLPPGLTAVLSATAVTDSQRLTVTATSAVPLGPYSVVVTGTSGAVTNPVTIAVTVGPAGSATVSLDLSACATRNISVWFAYQDGTGPYTEVSPASGVYSFPISTGKGATAIELIDGAYHDMYLSFGTPDELGLITLCRSPQHPIGSNSVTFATAGLAEGDIASLLLGGVQANLEPGGTTTVNFLPDGPLDIVGFRYLKTDPSQHVVGFLQRDASFLAGATNTLDFSQNTFTPPSATMHVSGPSGTAARLDYYTGPSCTVGGSITPFVDGVAFAPNGRYFGVPAALQRANDMYHFTGGTQSVYVGKYFHTLADQSLSTAAPLTAPSVTTLGVANEPYRRLQAVFGLPTDYSEAQFSYSSQTQSVKLIGHRGYFGSGAFTLAMPDLTGVAGFDPAWMPASGSVGGYTLVGRTAPYERCADGSVYQEATISGG